MTSPDADRRPDAHHASQRRPVSLHRVLEGIDELWSPHLLLTINDYDVKVAKVEGEFVWHRHPGTEEFFLVVSGYLSIDLRDGADEWTVEMTPGDTFVVPRNMLHRPWSRSGASIVLIEPKGTLNIGDFDGEVPGHVDVTTGRTAQP